MVLLPDPESTALYVHTYSTLVMLMLCSVFILYYLLVLLVLSYMGGRSRLETGFV